MNDVNFLKPCKIVLAKKDFDPTKILFNHRCSKCRSFITFEEPRVSNVEGIAYSSPAYSSKIYKQRI